MEKFKMYFVKLILPIALTTLSLGSCIENQDLMTSNVRTGGILDASGLVQFKPSAPNQDDSIYLSVYQGPPVVAVKVFKRYVHMADNSATPEMLLDNIVLNGANGTDTFYVTKIYSWDELKQGYSKLGNGIDDFPPDAASADVGDYFALKYVSVMDNGFESLNRSTTKILVANSYAGFYTSHITYFHPTLGGAYPDKPYINTYTQKQLITLSVTTCTMNFALWGSYGESMDITINPDNSVVFNIVGFDYIVNEGDPYNPAYHSYYDPTNSTIHLYYYWEGVGGYRVIWETLSPNI